MFPLKAVVLVVIFSLTFSPLTPLLAQEATNLDVSTSPENVPSTTESNSETGGGSNTGESLSTDTQDSVKDSNEDDSNAVQTTPSVTTAIQEIPNISNQSNANTKNIIPKPDLSTGALVYEYLLTVPSGRNSLQPNINLTYNSQNTKDDGVFGYGWELSIPYVERVARHGTNELYAGVYNDFSSSIDGEMAAVTPTSYGARADDGSVHTYTLSNNVFSFIDKAGIIYTFGETSGSRQDDPDDATRIAKWMISSITDANGNTINFTYTKDQGQIYPDTISYGGIFTIQFIKESKNDVYSSYIKAFLVKTAYRVKTIQINTNSALSRKYDLGYIYSSASGRSLLSSITESGYKESVMTTLPPVSFEYQLENPGWDSVTLGTLGSNNPNWGPVHIQDFNADSYPDILFSSGGTPCLNFDFKRLYNEDPKNKNWNFVTTVPSLMETCNFVYAGYQIRPAGTQIVDLDGDFFPDMLRHYVETHNFQTGGPGGYEVKERFKNVGGSSWTATSDWDTVYPLISDGFGEALLFDANADGLPDVISARDKKYQINTGNSFGATSTISSFPPTSLFSWVGQNTKIRIADINSDGLVDIVHDRDVYINTGDFTWVLDPAWYLPVVATIGVVNWGEVVPTQLVDVNGDGRIDIISDRAVAEMISLGVWGAYINNGNGWTRNTSWDLPQTGSGFGTCAFALHDANSHSFSDLNGDGLVDCVSIQPGPPMHVRGLINQSKIPDVLSKITLPTGGQTELTYKGSAAYSDTDGNLLNPNLPINIQTVNTIKTTDSVNSIFGTHTYEYSGGFYYYSDPFDRKFAGFGKVTEIAPDNSKQISYFHQGNTTDAVSGEYDDVYGKIGKIYRIEKMDNANNVYQKTVNKWDTYNLGTNRDFVKLIRSTTFAFDGNSTHRDTASEYVYDNANGNVISKTNYGEVIANNDGTFIDIGSDKSIENISYAFTSGNSIIGFPSRNTVIDQNGNKVRESKFYYDNLAFGSIDRGNQTKKEDWRAGAIYRSSERTYNSFGLITSETDPRGKITNHVYEAYNLYPSIVTNPLGYTTQYEYDYAFGKVKRVIDQNGFSYQTSYDGLGRVLSETVPDAYGTSVTKTTYAYTDIPNAVAVQKAEYLDNQNIVETYQYFDGLNRLVQERREAEAVGTFNVSDIKYNNLGLVQSESLPYVSVGSGKTSPTANTALYTTNTYDPLQRVTAIANSVGVTSNVYDDWKTTVTDPNGKVKKYSKDAYDNLVKVDEMNGSATYSTNYAWNLNNKLTNITDALGNVRNFTYDGLGQRLTAEDLHNSADTSFGTWTYAYDLAGNLTQTHNPENEIVDYTYDDINRQKTENFVGGTGIEITYDYDTCPNGVGKLCTVTQPTSKVVFEYTPSGLMSKENKEIHKSLFSTSFLYDRQGNVVQSIVPDQDTFYRSYNNAGLLEKIQYGQAGMKSMVRNVVENIDYSPVGQVSYQKNNNGTEIINTHDSSKLYRLTRKISQVGGSYVPVTNTNPTILLTGLSLMSVAVGSPWIEPGYSATDTEDGIITSSVLVSGSVDTSIPGTYQLIYNVTDSQGAPAADVRTVRVVIPFAMHVKALVVAGGGGGGAGSSDFGHYGGGGAGGYKYFASNPISTGLYPVTVGAAGSGTYNGQGINGGDSTFNEIMATGGGGGGGYYGAGSAGGSGGGGGTSGGSGVVGEGNSGGTGTTYGGAGGGGSATTGGNGATGAGGGGGAGTSNDITGTSVYYAAGGGGGAQYGSSGSGGVGGGGSGRVAGPGYFATGYGSGGGGSGWYNTHGGSGSSGIVIISYKTDGSDGLDASSSGGTKTTSGEYTIHSFTESGTFTSVAYLPATNTPPVISLTGSSLIEKVAGESWIEPGYSATDVEDGDLTNSVSVTGTVDTAIPGTYQLLYSVVDSQGMSAATLIRIVVIHPHNTFLNLQDLNYTYDNNGNITQVVDTSDTAGAKTVTYTYDDLNRMLSATATNVASGQSGYTYNYTYDALGNITSSPAGAYVYDGTSASNWANPHAATSIAGATLTYDKSGNMLSDEVLTNTWNYKQQLVQVEKDKNTFAYTYDHEGKRMRVMSDVEDTYYPNKFYSVDASDKKTKSVFVSDQLVATIETSTSTNSIFYNHTDHLGSVNVVTDAAGNAAQVLDYYPFGTKRISSGDGVSDREFIGQRFDESTNLNYLNARYYEGTRGQFISQDPSFLAFGDAGRTQAMTGMSLESVLMDPQSLNSYAYARNNPIKNIDPDGRWYKEVLSGQQSWSSFAGEVGEATQYMGGGWQTAMDHPVAAGAVVGVASGATALGISYLSGAGLVVDNLATGQMISTEGIQAIGARNSILNNSTNSKVIETINQIFKKGSDKIGGGTVEAVKRQIQTGELTGGRDHLIKGQQLINRISNLQNSQQLNQIEQKGLQTISNTLQKLLGNVKK